MRWGNLHEMIWGSGLRFCDSCTGGVELNEDHDQYLAGSNRCSPSLVDYADAAAVFVSCLPPSICLIDSVSAKRISAGIELI